MTTLHHPLTARPYEPRPQVAFPDSPPQTPPQSKEAHQQNFPASRPHAYAYSSTPTFTPQSSPHSSQHGCSSLPPTLDDSPAAIGLGIAVGDHSTSDIEKAMPSYPSKMTGKPLGAPFSHKIRSMVTPYRHTAQQPMTTLSAFLRIPRRLRPALLLAVSLFVVGTIFISRAMAEAGRMDVLVRQRQGLVGPFGRRFTEQGHDQGLYDINDKHQAPAIITDASRVKAPSKHGAEPITFYTKEDELLSLIAFITAATGNSLPSTMDRGAPIEPSVLLGFDPAGSSAADDLELLKEEVNSMYPIVLLGRMRDPWHRQLIELLNNWKIVPAPLVVDVDQRRDAGEFIPAIERLLGNDLPHLLLLGKSMGKARDILKLDQAQFRERLERSGAVELRKAKKSKDAKAKERHELERLLGPQRIVE